MPNLRPQKNIRPVCGSRLAHWCHWLPTGGGRPLVKTEQMFFSGNEHTRCFGRCAASKDVKGRTGQLVSLRSSSRHAGISLWVLTQQITSISKLFRENVTAFVLLYNPPKKTTKAIFEDYDGEPSSEEYKELMANLKKEKFLLSGLCPALSLRIQNFKLVYTASLNRMRPTKSCNCCVMLWASMSRFTQK